jgi:hypothetical protein
MPESLFNLASPAAPALSAPPAPPAPSDVTMAEPAPVGESAVSSSAVGSIEHMLVGDFPVRKTHWENEPVCSAIDIIEQAFQKSTQDPTVIFKRTLANAAKAGGKLDKYTCYLEVQGIPRNVYIFFKPHEIVHFYIY